jgi:beta-galactosidase
VASFCLFSATTSATAQRQRFSMDPGWRFTLGDAAEAQQPSFDDSRWRSLDLPHDWSIEGTPNKEAAEVTSLPASDGIGRPFACRQTRLAIQPGSSSTAFT